jgi:hypothetical protein
MRYFAFALLLTLSSCMNIRMATKEQMTHQHIAQPAASSREVVFERAMKWIALNFKSAKQVIDYSDKASGSIIAKGIIPRVDYGASVNGDLHFTLSIDIKEDGKMRFSYGGVEMWADNIFGGAPIRVGDTEGVHAAARREFAKLNDQMVAAVNSANDF